MSLVPSGFSKSGVSAFYSYDVGGSLRFPRATTSYLSRTFGTPSTDGEKCFTISVWVKRTGNTGNNNYIMDGHTANEHVLAFEGDLLRFGAWAGSDEFNLKTNARKLRDTTAWYHIVCAVDTRKAVDTERVIFYINGEKLPNGELQGTYPAQNYTGRLNVSGNTAQIGRWGSSTGREFEGYMAEFHFIDAQQQTADDFGEFKSGVWIPKEYSGTYGNNGFYLDMVSANFSGTTLSDSSGNSNNWTAAAGLASHDFMLDSCTNNFAICNNRQNATENSTSFSEGNLFLTANSGDIGAASPATLGFSTGKWYFECYVHTQQSDRMLMGVVNDYWTVTNNIGADANSWGVIMQSNVSNGQLFHNSSTSAGDLGSFANGDIAMCAVDADNNKIWFGRNGTWHNSGDPAAGTNAQFTNLASPPYRLAVNCTNTAGAKLIANFGQDSTFTGSTTAGGNSDDNGYGDFKYTVPSGFLSMCTANLPAPAIDPASDAEPRDYFETFRYSGNGGELQIGDVIKKPADTTTISNSVVFNNPTFNNGQYCTRTNTSTITDYTTWTFSCWFKRGNTNNTASTGLISSGSYSSPYEQIYLDANGEVFLRNDGGGSNQGVYGSDRFIEDNEWHHVVVSRSGTTVAMYLDGVSTGTLDTAFSASVFTLNDASAGQRLGSDERDRYDWDGYMAEVHFIDGTVYAASDFGSFDANGIWIPKAVTGITYGTNGFYLDFSDNTSTTTLGADSSGNGNDWTMNLFATTDQVSDSPTNKYPVLNSKNSVDMTLSEGNLNSAATGTTAHKSAIATQKLPKSGKFYWEVTLNSTATNGTNAVGVVSASYVNNVALSGAGNYFYAEGLAIYGNNGSAQGPAAYGKFDTSGSATTFTANDVIGVAYDADNKTINWYKNGTVMDYDVVFFDDVTYDFIPAASAYNNPAGAGNNFNFGQKSFAHTPPTGFVALSEDNITVNTQNLENPDLVWVKSRGAARHHGIFDSVRGVRKLLQSSSTDPETDRPGGVVDFNKNGFTLAYDPSWYYNEAGVDEVAWCWKAGTAFSNSAGTNGASVASSGKVNTDAGFSIISYTSPNTTNAESIAHGLSQAPEMVICKNLNNTYNWDIWHKDLTQGSGHGLIFNTNAETSGRWPNSVVTSSIINLAYNFEHYSTNDYICYAFHGVNGFSKFGIYQDDYEDDYNNDSPYVHLGFKPAFVMIKSTSAGRPWVIYDSKRSPVNPVDEWLQPNTTTVEQEGTVNSDMDFMAYGFKIKGGSGDINTTGEKYIYAAFAEMPQKYALAR